MKSRKFISIISLCFCMAICARGAEPANYYKSCDGKSGEALLKQLESVVGPHTTVSYDGLWTLYRTTDVDANGKIWDMYSTKRWNTGEKCGNYSKVGDCYNREHSFPKSWFNEKSPMKSDAFHVYPTDGKVNGQRSNYPFGECAGGTTLSAPSGIKALGRLGSSTFPGYSGKVFEPDDEYKGDFARTYFYMAAAYNDKIGGFSSDMLAGNSYPAFKQWAVNLLLKWHRQDPVSKKETDRNEAVYASQKNRNPFIDHPELAEYIWGDKKGEKWYVSGSPEPEITLPVNNSTVDFGLTAVNYQVSRSIQVKGTNLAAAVTATVSDSRFKVSPASVSASAAASGSAFTVTYMSAEADKASATLTLRSGAITVKVNLTAEAVEGIPAYQPTSVTSESFIAEWLDLGDEDRYVLDVKQGGVSIEGYPVTVAAAVQEYEVDNLQPLTTYTYQLSNSKLKSAVITVTTGAPLPSATITGEETIALSAVPGEPSEAMELWLDVENIDTDLTLTVGTPFELSTNHSDWSRSITMSPMNDRFYLRVNSQEAGHFESTVTITAGDYTNDDTDVEATVADNSKPWWVETFEGVNTNGYVNTNVAGTACVWKMKDVGTYPADDPFNGTRSARLGKTSTSELTTSSPKKGGIGTVSFDLSRWSGSDGDVTLVIEHSTDGDNWTNAGSVTCKSDKFENFSIPVKAEGYRYLRLRQTAGKRGNIDNIAMTDFVKSGVEAPEYEDNWDAYCDADSRLAINNMGDGARRFTVYDIKGTVLFNSIVPAGTVTLPLAPGIYLVSSDKMVRRLVVR